MHLIPRMNEIPVIDIQNNLESYQNHEDLFLMKYGHCF